MTRSSRLPSSRVAPATCWMRLYWSSRTVRSSATAHEPPPEEQLKFPQMMNLTPIRLSKSGHSKNYCSEGMPAKHSSSDSDSDSDSDGDSSEGMLGVALHYLVSLSSIPDRRRTISFRNVFSASKIDAGGVMVDAICSMKITQIILQTASHLKRPFITASFTAPFLLFQRTLKLLLTHAPMWVCVWKNIPQRHHKTNSKLHYTNQRSAEPFINLESRT
jgi:hypothetical protein